MLGNLYCNVGLEYPTINVVPKLKITKEELLKEAGSYLRRVRRANELTQVEVAKWTGISEMQLGRIEKGESGPRYNTVISLAQALGLDEEDLLSKFGFSLPAGYSFADEPIKKSVSVKSEKPKNFLELISALENLGIEIPGWAKHTNFDDYTEDDFEELKERIALDTDITIRRKKK